MGAVDAVLAKALRGERLGFEDGLVLFASNEIEKIGHVANTIKMRMHPDPITTFVIGRNINYTNICDVYCRFCAFYRPPGSPEGYVLPNETILAKIEETIHYGGTEILMQGGTNPDLPLTYYTDLLRLIKRTHPSITMHSFSPAEIHKMMDVSQLALPDVLRALHDAGLDSLPGGGAEILDNRTRKRISRLKGTWEQWIEVMTEAHRIGMHTTATMVIGLGETMEERVLHLLRVRDAQDVCRNERFPSPGFLAFIVWTFQPENTNLPLPRLGAEAYLHTLAIARLMLDNIPHFQSSWVTMGPDVGKQSIAYGCDDFGSTMIEENVVSAAGATHKVNIALLLRLIRETGHVPVQRNTQYEHIRVFNDPDAPIERDFVLPQP